MWPFAVDGMLKKKKRQKESTHSDDVDDGENEKILSAQHLQNQCGIFCSALSRMY